MNKNLKHYDPKIAALRAAVTITAVMVVLLVVGLSLAGYDTSSMAPTVIAFMPVAAAWALSQ